VGGVAAVLALLGSVTPGAWAADPLVVISVKTAGVTTVCDTNCSVCTIMSGECIAASEFDLLVCRPLSSGLPITSCDWSKLLDGTSMNVGIENQIRAVDVAPNGNLTMVVLNDDEIPTVGNLRKQDIAVFNPVDLLKPFTGGGPYVDGTYKLYLNGNLTQENDIDAKPWDALSILSSNGCEKNISALGSGDYTCPIVGSLTAGATTGPGLDGVHFENEDLLRCIPDAFNGHTVEGCKFAMFLEADRINGAGNGINGDIEAIDFLSFTPSTMTGEMVFKMSGVNPPGFPAHDNGKDLLLYDGTFGAGNCVPSNNPCASIDDCLMTDTECDTGSCAIGGAPCASDHDCASGTCNVTRDPTATVTKFFDGLMVGLNGTGQNIEAFALLPDTDGDAIPDGIDSCPTTPNSPNQCSGPGDETCPGGLNSECPMGETCVQSLVQPDADGDGVGDECDQCNGRPDPGTCDLCPGAECPIICAGGTNAECACGDGIFDFPGEECDLGMSNGPPSPCSLTCQISGRCTRNMMVCTNGSDCPQFATGEGCCGNNEVDDVDGMGGVIADEECDDGNAINNDTCSNLCKAAGGPPVLGCEDLTGPNILPASIKVAKFKDTEDAPDIDRWKTKGEAIFSTGLTIDPDTEPVTIIYNNIPDGLLFSSTLAPANFVQKDPKLKWKFKDKEADVPGSPGWRKGKFGIKQNKCKFLSDGRKTTLFTAMQIEPVNIRQTIRVGDVCITAVLDCAAKGSGFKCTIVP
jgi:hypothetical protein